MFCDCRAMQISAANLLATQQMKPAQQPAAATQANAFEALLFKQAGKPAAAAAETAGPIAANPSPGQKTLGSQIDIRI